MVVFPGMSLNFDLFDSNRLEGIKTACATDKQVFVITQKNYETDEPELEDLYNIGVVAEVKQLLKTPDKATRVLIQGKYKAKITALSKATM